MKQIKVVVNEGGLICEVLVSPEIAEDVSVEVIDFCTDDPDLCDEADKKYEAARIECASGRLVTVY